MKEDYVVRKVKDICFKGSSQIAQKDLNGVSGIYPIYGASGLIKNIDFYHQEKEYIGLVKDGSGIGRIMFLPPKSSVIGTLQYILPKEGYNIRYIGYCLQSLRLEKYKQGAAIPHIYFKDYGSIQYHSMVIRCSFDGLQLSLIGLGNKISFPSNVTFTSL